MYGYTYDAHTGGLLLNNSVSIFSKEPRPVYYYELDTLGFDRFCKYEKQDIQPYMWAEANCYYYRGKLVARTKGGNIFAAPELVMEMEDVLDENKKPKLDENNNKIRRRVLPESETLQSVDIPAMVKKNQEMINVIEQITVKKIFDVYKRYRKRTDCFHVAFSGGKDSIVLLELVKKALPRSGYMVVFGDTGMEFPDTYDVVDQVESQCRMEEIEFHRATSRFTPEESWKLFGPPSRVLRWCCAVHKSAPQVLKIRELINKPDYTGIAFVGVRSYESAKRDGQLTNKPVKLQNPDEKSFIDSYGKIEGQMATKSIYDWTSAEIWLYTYANNLVINEAYKKGSARVGCLCCPMGTSKADYFQYFNYPDEMSKYLKMISDSNGREISAEDYIGNGGWNARRNGRFLKGNKRCYRERNGDEDFYIEISNPKTNWREWIKTLGDIVSNGETYILDYKNRQIRFKVKAHENGYIVSLSQVLLKDDSEFGKLFKYVFHKAAYCVKCGTCESNCKKSCIKFDKDVTIEGCTRCHRCHNIEVGCHAYHSLNMPLKGESNMKSLNTFSNHAPKPDWLDQYFKEKDNYWKDCGLGIKQVPFFKRFLRDADLIENNQFTSFAEKIASIGWDTEAGLGLLLANLAYNPQIEWYIRNLDIGQIYPRSSVEDMLLSIGQSTNNISSIIAAFKRLSELPFGTKLRFCTITEKGKQVNTLARTKTTLSDNRVVLYALYKFAEACEGYYQFTLTRLFDNTIDSVGLSPVSIFGFDRDEMEQILNGLSANYPTFINATFTHDLDKITLREERKSTDVLTLF